MRNIQEENSLINEVMTEVRQMVKESMNGNRERLDSFVKNVIKPMGKGVYGVSPYFYAEPDNEARKIMESFDGYVYQFFTSRSKTGNKNFDTIVGKFLKAFHSTVSETIVQG